MFHRVDVACSAIVLQTTVLSTTMFLASYAGYWEYLHFKVIWLLGAGDHSLIFSSPEFTWAGPL